jgi:hypothetical protein
VMRARMRRRSVGRGTVLALLVVAGSLACRTPEGATGGEPSSANEVGTSSVAEAVSAETAPAESAASAWLEALEGAMARGIEPSGADDATYRVDSFVAVLLAEWLQQSGGAPIFSPIEVDAGAPAGPAGPAGGYRVGPLQTESVWHRLGLREGDVVESINGVVLSAPERLGFALDGAERRVRVVIHREDYVMTASYELAPGRGWTRLLAEMGDAESSVDGSLPDPWEPQTQSDAQEPAADPRVPAPHVAPSGGQPSAPVASTPPKSPGTSKSPPPSPPSARTKHASCESATQCKLSKAHFDSMLASPDRLLAQADIVPAIQNDVHSGYRLKTVRPGTTVADLGFRSGDKITHINGFDLTNDAQAMQLYLALAGSRLFKVRYERGAQRLVKSIVVE